MKPQLLLLILCAITVVAFWLGKARAISVAGGARGVRNLHSLPSHYGQFVGIWTLLPAVAIFLLWVMLSDAVITAKVGAHMPAEIAQLPADRFSLVMNDVRNVAAGRTPAALAEPLVREAAERYRSAKQTSDILLAVLVLATAVLAALFSRGRIRTDMRARNNVESVYRWLLFGCASVAILTTIGIVLSVLFETWRFFGRVPVTEFFGLKWSPQTAIRADQVGSSGAFGAVPLFVGTLLISGIAMIVAVPIGLFSAIFLAEYAPGKVRAVIKPLLEVLAGIPTVVYGFFAALTVGPSLRRLGESMGLDVASESALAAGLVMGIMIIPFVSSLADDMIAAVPQSLRDGAYALGATRSETIKQVVLRAALPGIVGGVLLAISRAIGETMIVVMAAGLAANLTLNPLEAVTTVTVQIVTLLVGDQEFDSAKTLAAFALGFVLFVVTLILNVVALYVVKRYREQYE
ncbi:MAG: phosphate ABC transporter permease subunit PstC [Steroidobacteraceae bacterium]